MAIATAPANPAPADTDRAERPVVWVAARRFGVVSEVWMRRQVNAMTRVSPSVVCWEKHDCESEPVACPVHVLAGTGRDSVGAARWFERVSGLRRKNFCGASPDDRRAMRDLAAKSPPRAILAHFGHIALRVLPVAASLDAPLVAHFHGLDLSQSLFNKWYRWSLWSNLHRFSAMVCVGSHQRRLLIDHGADPARVHLIPCGVPTDRFLPAEDRRRTGPTRFITVGRLVEWKGPHKIIESFARASSRLGDSTLTLIGDGPMRCQLEELSHRLGVAGRVAFLGDRPGHEIAELLHTSDVFLSHSLNVQGASEGFGVSVAEASASGLPVIATRCGGIEDQIVHNETGLLVPQNDTIAMSGAMIVLANDPDLRARLGEGGRRRVVEGFDTRRQVGLLEDVLLAVIAERGAAR